MAEVEILLRTKAELEGARKTLQALERQIGAAKAAGKSYEELSAKAARASAIIAQSERTVSGGAVASWGQRLRSGIGSLGTGLSAGVGAGLSRIGIAGAGALAGGAGIAAGIAKAVKEFASQEQAIVALDTALAQTGQLTDDYRIKLQKLADQLQDTTAVADDQWYAVLKTLTQFGGTPDNIDKLVEGVKNLAGLMEGDVVQASVAMGKAMQGNYQQLQRMGITAGETGTQAEKLDRILQQLALRGGGQLEAASRTLAGRFASLKNIIGDFFEALAQNAKVPEIASWAIDKLTVATRYYRDIGLQAYKMQEGLKNAKVQTLKSAKELEDETKRETQAIKQQSQAYDELIDRQEKEAEFAKEIAEAKRDRALELIAAREKSGALSPEQAAQHRAAINTFADTEIFRGGQSAILSRIRTESTAFGKATTDEERWKRYKNIESLDMQLNQNRTLFGIQSQTSRIRNAADAGNLPNASQERQSDLASMIQSGIRLTAQESRELRNLMIQDQRFRQEVIRYIIANSQRNAQQMAALRTP